MQRPFRYYVAFTRQLPAGTYYGGIEISLEYPVRGMDDVNVLHDILAENGHPDAFVLSFCPFTPTAPSVVMNARG